MLVEKSVVFHLPGETMGMRGGGGGVVTTPNTKRNRGYFKLHADCKK